MKPTYYVLEWHDEWQVWKLLESSNTSRIELRDKYIGMGHRRQLYIVDTEEYLKLLNEGRIMASDSPPKSLAEQISNALISQLTNERIWAVGAFDGMHGLEKRLVSENFQHSYEQGYTEGQKYYREKTRKEIRINDECTLEDYYQAPSEIGPLASTWKDKPHRLIYDLVEYITDLPDNE